MRRRSERKRSTETVSPPPVLKRTRRSRRSPSLNETPQKTTQSDEGVQNEIISEECKPAIDSVSINNGELKEKESSLPPPEADLKTQALKEEVLETIAEAPIENNEEIQDETNKDSTDKPNPAEKECVGTSGSPEDKSNDNKSTEEESNTQTPPEEPNNVLHEENKISKPDMEKPAHVFDHNRVDVEENRKIGETIAEAPLEINEQIQEETSKDSTDKAYSTETKCFETTESQDDEKSKENKNFEQEESNTQTSSGATNDVSNEEKEISKTGVEKPAYVFEQKMHDVDENSKVREVREHSKETELEQEKNKSQEKIVTSTSVSESKKNLSRNKERRSQILLRKKEKQENDENDESKGKLESISTSSTKEKTKSTRKRRWISKRTNDSSSQILAISTDSLKNLISDVHPVPLCDVKLESSSDVEEVESEREEGEASPTPVKPRIEKGNVFDNKRTSTTKMYEKPIRKISLLSDKDDHLPPIPTKNETSCILYITNLVRPFTVLQLKGLLARTGKIVENGFWIDKIKSKCYVQYETEDEAIETRHALHGVRWPTSNPKCLNVDFGSVVDMEKAMASSQDNGSQFGKDISRENRIVGTGWDRDRFDFEEKKIQVGRPVREWDVGKREELEMEAERTRKREKMRAIERGERVIHNERADKESIRNDERNERERDRKRRSPDRERRRSASVSPGRKIKKKNNDPPLRLLDDLFRKTKTTPCIYWLPLTPEQIAEKEAFRLRRIAEHQERIRLRELEKEKNRERAREKEREREKERRRERDRSNGYRRTNSRDRRRY